MLVIYSDKSEFKLFPAGLDTLCPLLYQSVVSTVRSLSSHGHHHRMECEQCLSYLQTVEAILNSVSKTNNIKQGNLPISQAEVEKEMVARASREENSIVLNDKIICCYICVVVIVILVLVIVIIVLSVMDDQKYKIF